MAETQEEKNTEDGSKEEEAKDQEEKEEEVMAEKKGRGRGKKGGRKKRKRGGKKEVSEKSREEGAEKKQRKKRSVSREGPLPPAVVRPVRERKAVERYSSPSPRRVLVPKVPTIEQGTGTKLRDIPNVLFKLSKRKVDDNLNVLHTILFGRKSNVHFLKRNILQFSGFVWAGKEEKQRAKVKEKLDKCTKDKLLDFCHLFDIPVNKAIIKKEEASAKLLEFLESPYVTRDVILAEKAQRGKKRKWTKEVTQTSGEASPDRDIKKQKRNPETEVKRGRKHSAKADKEAKDGVGSGDLEENDHQKSNSEDEEDEPEKPVLRKKSSDKLAKIGGSKIKEKASLVKKASFAKSNKNTSKSILKASSAAQEESKASVKSKKVSFNEPIRRGSKAVTKEKAAPLKKGSVKISKRVSNSSRKSASVNYSDSALPSTSKSRKEDKSKGHSNKKPTTEDKKASKKETINSESKVSTKEKGKRKAGGNAVKGPSREEMLPVVSDILKEVDFDVATLADILKQLEAHFKVDLMDRRVEVKGVIEEVIHNMMDVEEDEEDEGNAEDGEGRDDKEGSDEDPEEDPEEGSDGGDGDE